MKAFKKGQKVTLFKNYDGKGTFSYKRCIVHSCGNKQMILLDEETGTLSGRNFKPREGNMHVESPNLCLNLGGVFPSENDEDTVKRGLKLAKSFLKGETYCVYNLMTTYKDQHSYCLRLQERLDQLHEPRVIEEE